jgi:hypothetical protein
MLCKDLFLFLQCLEFTATFLVLANKSVTRSIDFINFIICRITGPGVNQNILIKMHPIGAQSI